MQDCAAYWDGDDFVLRVKVQPLASRNEILNVRNAQLRVRTTTAPTDGKANKAVICMLADYLHVAPSRIKLTHGQTQRNKRFLVAGPLTVPATLCVAMKAPNGL